MHIKNSTAHYQFNLLKQFLFLIHAYTGKIVTEIKYIKVIKLKLEYEQKSDSTSVCLKIDFALKKETFKDYLIIKKII